MKNRIWYIIVIIFLLLVVAFLIWEMVIILDDIAEINCKQGVDRGCEENNCDDQVLQSSYEFCEEYF